MDLFSPDRLLGVGVGDVTSLAAVVGLIGVAVAVGMLVSEGVVGTVVFIAALLALVAAAFTEVPVVALVGCAVVGVFAVLRLVATRSAERERARIVGAAADSPDTKTARRRIASRERLARGLAISAVAVAGACVGYLWAEWNETPFDHVDTESVIALAIALVAAAVGGDGAWRFLDGARRAGGSAIIVGVVVALTALILAAASLYIPFVGVVSALVALVLSLRLRRRAAQRAPGGLRMLR